jgi:hypothetical protein
MNLHLFINSFPYFLWWDISLIKGNSCHRRVTIVQILCTHVCKWKNETCWNYSRNGKWGGWRRMLEKVNSYLNSQIYLWYIVRTFVNVIMYFQHNNINKWINKTEVFLKLMSISSFLLFRCQSYCMLKNVASRIKMKIEEIKWNKVTKLVGIYYIQLVC